MPNNYETTHVLEPDKWVVLYSDALYSFTLLRVSDSETAKDIVQDVFLSAWKNKDSYKGKASEKNWLYTICKNKIIDHYRKTAAAVTTTLNSDSFYDEYFEDSDKWDKLATPVDWRIDYTQSIETKEFYKILEYCKDKLQELQRAVFVMKYIDDVNSEEICKVLDISSSNYWVLIHRAKLQLRKCLEKKWFDK